MARPKHEQIKVNDITVGACQQRMEYDVCAMEEYSHAMKAGDPLKAFGAVLGKALRPWQSGQGMIPILIALQ